MHTQSKFRLLVVRLGAMGDILHALPAITALRQAHPGWQIDWVVEPRWRALLAAESSTGRDSDAPLPLQPLIDTLYLAPVKLWAAQPLAAGTRRAIFALRRTLRAGEYDSVIDLQGAVRSAGIARMAGSRRVIGEEAPREWAARWLFSERIPTRGAHVIEQDIEVASAVAGDALTFVQPWLPVDPVAEAWAAGLFAGLGTKPAVLINPGAGWGAKCWPIERYAAVAQALTERGCAVLINAGPGEEALAGVILTATRSAAVQLRPSLEHLIAVTRRVALVIAGDTGPLHLACALGRPVVGIYGPTLPSRNGPFGTRFKVLRHPESKRDHARREAPEAGLLTIKPEDVLAAAEELLAGEGAA